MIQDSIPELVIVGIYDAGIPNSERIALQAQSPIDLGCYALQLGTLGMNGAVTPIKDHFLWLNQGKLNTGDWIFVYTAPGNFRSEKIENSSEMLYSMHWGKRETVLQNRDIVPILIRFDGFQYSNSHYGNHPPQIAGNTAYLT